MLDVREAVHSLWAIPESTRAVQSLYRFLTSSVAALLQVQYRHCAPGPSMDCNDAASWQRRILLHFIAPAQLIGRLSHHLR